ncbi:MAG TPA: hypothetical protein P5218_06515, partial [Planctomycetota bacterium]|nr:hypothetical protein [Planctomycetota bacterium]
MTSFEPQRRPQSRKRKSLLPIILILGFVFWLSKRNEKDKFGVTLRTTSSTEILAKQRDAYPEGPEGTVARLEDSLGQAEATLTTLQSERRVLERQVADTDALLGEFKTAYLSAKNGSPWPVPVRGRSYSEAQLTSKVQSLLEIREQLGNQQTI